MQSKRREQMRHSFVKVGDGVWALWGCKQKGHAGQMLQVIGELVGCFICLCTASARDGTVGKLREGNNSRVRFETKKNCEEYHQYEASEWNDFRKRS
jgi:hypothetical protein